jgi:hypothetical protein
MRKGTFVSAMALTMALMSWAVPGPAQAQDFGSSYGEGQTSGHLAPIIKEFHIARLRAALNLTPAQHAYWTPVEAALRSIARLQSRDVAAVGFVQRMNDRASSMAGEAMQLRRLASAARPLIQTLDETQKRDGMALARHYGFDRLVSAF